MREWVLWRDPEEELRKLLDNAEHPRDGSGQRVLEAIRPRGGIVGPVAALAAVAGILLGIALQGDSSHAYLALGARSVFLVGLLIAGRQSRGRTSTWRLRSLGRCGWILSVGVALLFAAWCSQNEKNALSEILDRGEPAIVRLRGIILDTPALHLPRQGELDRFAHRGESWSTRLELRSVVSQERSEIALDGVIRVRIDHEPIGFGAGDDIETLGRLHPIRAPSNPGERDRRARDSGQIPALLVVTDPRLLTHVPESRELRSMWLRLRSEVRAKLSEIVRSLAGTDPMREALLGAVFLGERSSGSDELRRRFASSGLAHLLAISGLHLAALAATTAVFLSILVSDARLRLAMTAVVVLGYSAMLDPRTSVQRAGITIGFVLLGSAFDVRWRPGPLIAFVAVIVLFLDPWAIMEPGFQLSFGVTAALALLVAPCRRRWFGPSDQLGHTRSSIVRSRFIDAATAAIVAWLIGAPIVMHHFGRVAPAGIPATLLASIPMILLLGTGFPLILLGIASSTLASVGAFVMAPIADSLLAITGAFAHLVPAIPVAPPAAGWTLIAVLGVALGLGAPNRRWRRLGWAAGLLAFAVPLVATQALNRNAPYTITALAVGDGTAIIVRSGRSAILFDAGSSSISALGERVVVPALHELGIRRLNAIVISHANLDHVSAIPDVLDALRVDRVIVSSHMLLRAKTSHDGMAFSVIDAARSRGVRVETANRGDELEFGELHMEVLHPQFGEACRSINDESIVARVTARNRHARILLCGDAQDEALARVMAREAVNSAHVMELPHHGSWRTIASAFLHQVNPDLVIQSTGPSRMRPDRWAQAMAGRSRWVTCRDGAAHILLD